MKRFLQEVVWRLSLVAALLTCASLAAWGQEETPEKVMYPVYTNVQGNVTIDVPSEIAEGETLYFTIGRGAGVEGSGVGASHGGKNCDIESDGNSQYHISDIKGPVLIYVQEMKTYTTADGITYFGSMNSFTISDSRKGMTQPSSSSVELKNVVQIDGVNYWVQNYQGCFNEYENVTSMTFPNTVMYFGANSIDKQIGLKEIHAKAIDPSHYDIDEAFGTKDLSGVTLYVPQGYLDAYKQSVFGSLFTTIVEEDEAAPTEFDVYLIGAGIKDYTPKSAAKGQDFLVDYTLESGYYSCDPNPFVMHAEGTDCTQILDLKITNKMYQQGGASYALLDEYVEAYLYEVDAEELVIPTYVTSGKNTYLVMVPQIVSGDLSRIRKMTIEGSMSRIRLSSGVFEGCTALEEIHCKGEDPEASSIVFSAFPTSIRNTCVVYVPKGCVEAYKASNWGMFSNIVEEGTVVNTR